MKSIGIIYCKPAHSMRGVVLVVLFSLLVGFSVQVTVTSVYGNLGGFPRPTNIVTAPGRDNIFVTLQTGIIKTFPRVNPTAAVNFLDITTVTYSTNSETGLLGLAFHPNYQNNRYLFIYRNTAVTQTVLSRFRTSSTNPDFVDPSTEEVLFTIPQPFSNHNGGQLAFGPDGYLYLGSGDGGSGGDPQGNGQKLTTALGKILRFDVDTPNPPKLYSIPPTNPFPTGSVPEIYAYGLRNPWRFSFASNGDIWVGDVGQNAFEEITVITAPGQNFGWKIMEACHCFGTTTCDNSGMIQPVWEYDHSLGSSITGGYIYQGSAVPELRNKYIYGDYVSGRIWALDVNSIATDCLSSAPSVIATGITGVSTFGVANGEIYLAAGSSLFIIGPDGPSSSTSTSTRTASPSMSTAGSSSRSASPSPSSVNAPLPPNTYPSTLTDGGTMIEYAIDQSDSSWIHFRLTIASTGWIALGISANGEMNGGGAGSDIVMGYIDNSASSFVNDYFTTGQIRPTLDTQANIYHTNIQRVNANLVMKFTRKLTTGDTAQDLIIPVNTNFFLIWAYSDTVPTSVSSFVRHDDRGSVAVNIDPNGPSASSSSTRTPSSSISRSSSITPSKTPSSTQSRSVGSSPTGTPSKTGSNTGTPSRTRSGTSSPSGTRTSSVTASGTRTSSSTASNPPTPSRTGSIGASTTRTPSGSRTAAQTPSRTQTQFVEQTRTSTPTTTRTAQSRSNTPTRTQSTIPDSSGETSTSVITTLSSFFSSFTSSSFTSTSFTSIYSSGSSSDSGASLVAFAFVNLLVPIFIALI